VLRTGASIEFDRILCFFFCTMLCSTGYTQRNGTVSKVSKKFISHLTRAQRTPSAAATVQVSHALPAVGGGSGNAAADQVSVCCSLYVSRTEFSTHV
jgi:hypothetical protein